MENNYVRLVGTIKRNSEAVGGRLEFTLEVLNAKGDKLWFDCVCTRNSEAYGQLEGFVNEGEPIEVIGHLVKNSLTERTRLGDTRIETRTTRVGVYVDEVVTEE